MYKPINVIIGLILCASVARAADALLWVEGESATTRQTFPNVLFDKVADDELSGGQLISSFSEAAQPTGNAAYDIDLPADGKYTLYVRANPRSTGLLYQVDGGQWVNVDPKNLDKQDQDNSRKKAYVKKIMDVTNIAIDGINDFRYLAWIDAGVMELNKGKHSLVFNLGGNSGPARFAAIDCFVLTTGSFTPNGKYKPGETSAPYYEFDPGKTWTFKATDDLLSPDAMIDHRSLNENVAGEHGFIKLSEDGNSFVRGDGEPIRFWGGTDSVHRTAWENGHGKMEELEHHAAFLAKRGINTVRFHGEMPPKKEGSAITDFDAAELDRAFRLVAGMKKHGIYTIVSAYYAAPTHVKKSWNVPASGWDSAMGLVYFDPTMQSGYKAWVKALFTTVNPYTGIALKDDPAVSLIQLQNEDSMLFWTMQNVKGEQLTNLRKLYATFLTDKYGTLDKAAAAWKGYAAADDDLANGMPGMFMIWEFTSQARAKKGSDIGRETRLADQFEFMCGVMHKFNADMVKYLRDDLGCKQLINAGNWKTGDDTIMGDGERWSYTAAEVEAQNHYYNGGFYHGINQGWQILADNVYTNLSATLDPTELPVNIRQVWGHPFIIPESLWVPPLLYQSEGPLMVAGQSSLSGMGTFFWFDNFSTEWQGPMPIWSYATPMQLGQFPATALIYRKGYVKRADPVVLEQKSLADVWSRKAPLLNEGTAFDANRDSTQLPPGSSVKTFVDPLAFLAGPVYVNYGGDPTKSFVSPNLGKLIDREHKIVHSATGEIALDYGIGLYTINAPKAQAAAGFLAKAGPQKLADVTIDAKNDYATIIAVSLDDLPLAISKKMLLQVGTLCRPDGWLVHPTQRTSDGKTYDAFRILNTGGKTWTIANTDGTVTINNPALSRATALDPNMMPMTEKVSVERDGDQLRVTLPPDALYVVLQP